MSIRFVEKNLFDVHNVGMTDRHQAPSYPLRMPPELKERVADAAKTSGRSLHAEIVSRLENSFIGITDGERLQRALGELRVELVEIAKIRRDLQELNDPTGDTDLGD